MHSECIKWPPSNCAGPSAPLPPRTEGRRGVQIWWICTAAPVLDAHTNPHSHLEDTERHWQWNIRSVWDPNRKTLKCKAVIESKIQDLPFPDHRAFARLFSAAQTSLRGREKSHTYIHNTLHGIAKAHDHPLKPIHKVQLKKLPLLWPPWSWLPPQWDLEPSHSWSHSY